MKKVLLFAVILLLSAVLRAQKVYFIYIQSEGGTPFYLKMGDKVLSSSAAGYLIVPQLKDSTYSFLLGQAGTQNSELRFSVPIKGTDHGFLFKKFSNGWGLFNLQTSSVIMPSESATSLLMSKTLQDDRFTNILATAVDDSTLLMQPVFAKNTEDNKKEPQKQTEARTEEPAVGLKNETAPTANTPTSAALGTTQEVKEVLKSDTVVSTTTLPEKGTDTTSALSDEKIALKKEEEVPVIVSAPSPSQTYRKSVIKKYSESSTTEGLGIVFLDEFDDTVDTIRIFIPNPPFLFQEEKPMASASISFLDSNAGNSQQRTEGVKAQRSSENSICKQTATDGDFFTLRKQMAARENEEEMIEEAKAYFREKCFTSEQIRNFSTLFLTQQGKMRFLEAAYKHVSDRDQFAALQSELKEEAYINRFKALLEN